MKPSVLLMLVAGCTCGSPPEAPPPGTPAVRPQVQVDPDAVRPPNVLVLVWDTVRADRMSAYGYHKPTTPRIAEWAKGARVYERAVSPGVWTLPSHGSLFTGLPVRSHGVTADHKSLDPAHDTYAETLSAQGWDTWSFAANPYLTDDTLLMQGFQEQEHPWDQAWKKKARALLGSKLIAEDASTPVSPAWRGSADAGQNKYTFKEAGPVAQEAMLAWLDRREGPDKPWFAFINYMEAHLPRVPTLASRELVMTPEEIARGYEVEETTTSFHRWMAGKAELSALDLAAISGIYDASLIDLDATTGSLLDALAARGVLDDTIVVLTSDHGEHLGEGGLLLHKYSVSQALSHVPLIVSWPGHIEPSRIVAPISVSDAIGVAAREGNLPVEPGAAGSRAPVTEFSAVAKGSLDRLKKHWPRLSTARFERTFEALELGPFKVVEASDGTSQLFDRVADPAEEHDLATERPEDAARMARALEAWRTRVPPYVPGEDVVSPKEIDPELAAALELLGYVE